MATNSQTSGNTNTNPIPTKVTFFSGRYTLSGIYQLFMVVAFPIQAWAMLLSFGDVSWVAARTNSWDAIGVVSYALLYALLETIALTLILLVLDFLLPTSWKIERRVGFLGTLFIILTVWAILEQLFFLLGLHFPSWFLDFLIRSGHPLRAIWIIVLPIIGLSFLLPAMWLIRSKKAQDAVSKIFERIVILSSFYLVLDIAGIIIVAFRNL